MKNLYTFALAFLTSFAAWSQDSGFNLELSKQRCLQSFDVKNELYQNEFFGTFTLVEMELKFHEIYNSGKRLAFHSVYRPEEDTFFLFFNSSDGSKPVAINATFIKSVTQQIENSLKKKFADFIFFPDMGHSHLYFPQEHWDSEYRDYMTTISGLEYDELYTKMYSDPKMQPLYHTAEKLVMKVDGEHVESDYVRLRFWQRNPVGQNDGSGAVHLAMNPEHDYNTVGNIEGKHRWGAGFSVSSSKDGCFPYQTAKGETLFFDIGLVDLRLNPNETYSNY